MQTLSMRQSIVSARRLWMTATLLSLSCSQVLVAATPDDTFKMTPQEITAAFRSKNSDEVIAKLDAAIEANPHSQELISAERQVIMLLGGSQLSAASERATKLLKRLEASSGENDSAKELYASTVLGVSSVISRAESPEKAIALLEKAEGLLEGTKSMLKGSLAVAKARMLLQANKAEEARTVLGDAYQRVRDQVIKGEASLQSLVAITGNYQSFFEDEFAADVAAKLEETERLVRDRMDGESFGVADLQAFFQMKLSSASGLIYSDVHKAKDAFDELSSELTKYGEKLPESEHSAVEGLRRTLERQMGPLEAALKREALIGTQAPELEPLSFVAMEPVTMGELKGKVVLVDFWAVWCGPCIATFPHLKHLHDAYSNKGLVILGVTQPYNYTWNEETNRAERSEDSVVIADELAMLEKFRAHHELRHGFVVNPKENEYSKAFQVSGIPQAAVIDKEGKIQLIRVGSGDANAKAIEETIQKLLAN